MFNLPVILAIVVVMVLLRLVKASLLIWILAWWIARYVFVGRGFTTPVPASAQNIYMGIVTLALVAYVTSQSRGVKMNVSLDHPRMKEMYALGENMFYFRGGTHDFACATCHGEDNKRIRLQDLPNLTTREGAQKAYTTWPAYRVSQGELRTFQWRLYDCFRQQRFPELVFTSDASIALTTFLARNANGAAFDAPAIKR